jgi:hypothetical protein
MEVMNHCSLCFTITLMLKSDHHEKVQSNPLEYQRTTASTKDIHTDKLTMAKQKVSTN